MPVEKDERTDRKQARQADEEDHRRPGEDHHGARLRVNAEIGAAQQVIKCGEDGERRGAS